MKIIAQLPDGISISSNTYGACIVAVKKVPKGTRIYSSKCHLVGGDVKKYLLQIDDLEFEMDMAEHAVKCAVGNTRQVYSFDGFMNHSCAPNVYCPGTGVTPEGCLKYDCIAVKDIEPGDEVTCDYAQFDYECDGHAIEKCLCGESGCRGYMMGFQGLTLEQKVIAMPNVDNEIIARFLEDNPHVEIYDATGDIPDGVKVQVVDASGDSRRTVSLVTAAHFTKGSLIYKNSIRRVTDASAQFIVKIGGVYVLTSQEEHFISREGFREFLGFDCFMNHSCEPTTLQVYSSADEYQVWAARDLVPGDELTCDYATLQNVATGAESLATIDFECSCGSSECRGRIVA